MANSLPNELSVEWVPTDQLSLNSSNPRINDQAVEHVAASIRRFGWRQPIVARPGGIVIAGNTRLKAARLLGHERVPVVRFESTDLEATA
ncbi:MAG TPA: ParB N-terminal domain-containing protein, partial [Planctomycetota bacterium]